MRTFTVYGAKIRACNAGCADSFRTDRGMSMIYPAVDLDDGTWTSWENASHKLHFCAYCGEYDRKHLAKQGIE